MSMSTQTGSGLWSCAVKRDPETSMYVAHCLDLNVKVAGRNQQEAWDSLKKVLKAHYEYCFQNDKAGLDLTAPASDSLEFRKGLEKALKEHPESVMVESIELTLRLPKVPEQVVPLSYQGVNIEQQSAAA